MSPAHPRPQELRLAEQIVRFARALRATGMRVGPGAAVDAVVAAEAAGSARRQDFYWALHSTLVKRHEDDPVFAEAFRLFWRRRDPNEAILAELLPRSPEAATERPAQRRVQEALAEGGPPRLPRPKPEAEREVDMRGSASDIEILRHKDFAQMTASELGTVREAISRMTLLWSEVRARRLVPNARGRRIDLRRTLRASLRAGGEMIALKRLARGHRLPPLVALVDISGSMSDYSRVLLHFLHALAESRGRVSTFLFGTRLTNVTRALKTRDPDAALAACGQAASDWAGGTWISSSLHRFNRDWSRRVLAQGAIVLLITDGLEREAGDELSREMDRLHRSCRKLIWLNPLLRYARFEPKAAGIRAMLPHVDELRPVHNLASLEDLCAALAVRPANAPGATALPAAEPLP
ncbi:MAG: VWA domain-containing protein [Bradyrhizobiaceae bacterium]|nr:VWA domain-containing protein [Bradyrhizobiaceae bacterium]